MANVRTDNDNSDALFGRPAYRRLGSVLQCILEVEDPSKLRWYHDETGFVFRFHTVSRGWSQWKRDHEIAPWTLAADDPNGTAERLAARDLYPMEWIGSKRWAGIRPCHVGFLMNGLIAKVCARCKNTGRYLERDEFPFELLWRFASEPEVILAVEALALEMSRGLFDCELSVAWRTEKISDLGPVLENRPSLSPWLLERAVLPIHTVEAWKKALKEPYSEGALPTPTEPWHQPLQELMRYGYEYGGMHDESTMILIAPD